MKLTLALAVATAMAFSGATTAPPAVSAANHTIALEHYKRGLELYAQDRIREAQREFKQATALDPRAEWAFAALGRTYVALGELALGKAQIDHVQALREKRWRREEVAMRGGLPQAEFDRVIGETFEVSRLEFDARNFERLQAELYSATRDAAPVRAACKESGPGNRFDVIFAEMVESPDTNVRNRGKWLTDTWLDGCPDDDVVRGAYGVALLHIGDRQSAGQQLSRVFHHRPLSQTLDVDSLVNLYQSEQYSEALELSEAMSREWPINPNGPYVGSFAAFHLDRYSDQVALVERLRELQPSAVKEDVLARLGVAYGALGQFKRSRDAFAEAQRLKPSSSVLEWQIVSTFAADGEDAAFAAAAHQSPRVSVPNALEIAYYGLRDFAQRAERANNRYAALANYGLAYRALHLLYRKSDVETAWAVAEKEKLWSKIVAIQASLPARLVPDPLALEAARQAQDAAAQGQAERAADLYAEAVERAPWSPMLHFNHALALGSRFLNDLPRAVGEMKAYLVLAPEGARVSDANAKILEWQEMIETAKKTKCGGEVRQSPLHEGSPGESWLLMSPMEAC